ncbi:MAG: RloB family protein [Clostridiales bacterium]|nr:RloB family protein [Clostridiales bacterium]
MVSERSERIFEKEFPIWDITLECWIIFDRDEVVNFNKIIADAKTQGVNAGWSNPCIEIWFDAYFGRMHNYQDSVQCCRGFAATYEKKTGNEYRKANKNGVSQ